MERRSREVKRERSTERSRSRSRSGRDRSRDRPPGARLADKRVYISNIPYDSRWQDIKDLFRKEVGEVAFVELFSDETEKPRGCGIIEFENAPTAKKAIDKMHRFELGGRKIVVKEDYDVERDKYGRIVTNSQGRRDGERGGRERSRERERNDRGGGGGGDWDRTQANQGNGSWNSYGLSSQFLESLGIEGPLLSRVFVSNLDFRVDEKKLKEVFRLAGRVLDVELNKDKDGKSRGHCVIEFEHPVEAVQAISMLNNQQLFERRIHVKMDRLADPLTDLANNKLPEGLKGIGMGLGMNGKPLVDVAASVAKNANATVSIGTGAVGSAANTITATPIVTAMNINPAMGNLASLMASQSSLDMSNMPSAAAAAALSNAFGGGMAGMGGLSSGNQYASVGNGGLAAALQNSGMSGLQSAQGVNNTMMMGGGGGTLGGNAGQLSGANIGTAAGGQTQPSPFQVQNSVSNSNAGYRGDMDYGFSSSVYSTPGTNYNTAYQREKQQFNNGSGGNISGGKVSNTVIVANLPASCTWQMLKTKFRECGEVVFAEMRDKNTGIVRFAAERDAERAVSIFDQSRVDGRLVEVRFL